MPPRRAASALAVLCVFLPPLAGDPPAPPVSDRIVGTAAVDVGELARSWASLSPAERAAALAALVTRTDEPARLLLIRVLVDRSAAPAVRRAAIAAIAPWEDPRPVLPLLDVVAEGPSGPALAAVAALARRADDPRVTRRLPDLAGHERAGIRRLAYELAGESHAARTLPLVARGLADSDPAARAAAFAAAGRRAYAPAIVVLSAALGAGERECALAAAAALATYGTAASSAVLPALAILRDPAVDPALRAAVPALLAHFHDEVPVRDALAAHAHHPDPAIATACRLALGAHGGVR